MFLYGSVWNADTSALLHTLQTPGKGLLAFGPDNTLWTARHDWTNGQLHAFTRLLGSTCATSPNAGADCPYIFRRLVK